MKLRHLFATLSLAVVAGAGVAAGLSSGNEAMKAEAANATVYFNFSEFGSTYGDNNEYNTKYFIWAFNSNNSVADAWFTASPLSGYPNKVYSISCDESYMGFIAVRASQDAEAGWVDSSAGRWNQTCDITRSSSSKNYFWVWSEGEGKFGNKFTPFEIKTTTLSFLGGANYSMYYDYGYSDNPHQYSLTSQSITSSQKFVITQGGNTYGYSDLEDGCKSMFNEEANDYISVKNDSLYAIYLKDSGKIWAQIDSYEEASQWAEKFVKGVGCSSPYNAKPANWDTYAASFATLTNGGKDVLIGATASNANNASYIQQAAFIHDMCVAKYEGCSVFMTREGGGSRAVVPVNYRITTANNSTIIVVVASVITVTSVATFFLLKKKKEN